MDIPPTPLIPVVPGQRYSLSHKGDGVLRMTFRDKADREIKPAYTAPCEPVAPADASFVKVERVGPGSFIAEKLIPLPVDALTSLPAKTVMPDRLSVDPKSPFYNGELIRRGVGVRFKGAERKNVEEYCLSERWVRLQTSVAKDRSGRRMCVKLQGDVEVWMRDET